MIDSFLDRLEKVKPLHNGKYMARCPAHEDGRPSLMISANQVKISLHCFAGCSIDDICLSVGMQVKDLYFDNQSEFDKDKWRLEKLSVEAKEVHGIILMYEQEDKLSDKEQEKLLQHRKRFYYLQKQIRSLM